MAERKTLTITQANEIQKVGEKQIPKLSFKAKDGDKELTYFTFKSSLFELIKEGQTINAEVETEQRGEYTNRKVVQVYVDGQPLGGQKSQYRGKSPEELEQTARLMILAYAKDLAVAQVIPLDGIIKQADTFYSWLKGNGAKAKPKEKPKGESKEESTDGDFENPGEFYTACLDDFRPAKEGMGDNNSHIRAKARENIKEEAHGTILWMRDETRSTTYLGENTSSL